MSAAWYWFFTVRLLVIAYLGCVLGGTALAQEEGADAEPTAEKVEEVVPTEAEQRELGAEEDPLAASQAKREVERAEEEATGEERTTGFDIYGSVRIRYRNTGDDRGLQDGGSRMGGELDWQFSPGSFLLSRYEVGFNFLTGLEDLNPGKSGSEEFEETFFRRLLYVGLDSPSVAALLGKNWSTYYSVSVFTDRFEGTGGSASGTYNAQTDGGPTGTGRADKTLQSKISVDFLPQKWFKPFDLNIQFQNGNAIPFGEGADYGVAGGLSAVATTHDNLTFGLAYNRATVDLKQNKGLRTKGISGDARALIFGTRAFGDRWYAGFTLARLNNHETTDQGLYFDGFGAEFYGQYQVSDRWWLIGGFNVLEPDQDEKLAGDYRVRYGVLGLRYTFDEFRNMVYANVQIEDSVAADGTEAGNRYTVGVRWDLSKRGWHMKPGG